MIFLFCSICLISLFLILSPLSPVKLALSLIVVRMMLFLEVYIFNSRVWMASIYIIIFVGGIIVMFMIMVSLLPNEKNLKMGKLILISFLVVLPLSRGLLRDVQMENCLNHTSKVIFFSNERFETLIIVILLYFFSFLAILSKETSTLRSSVC